MKTLEDLLNNIATNIKTHDPAWYAIQKLQIKRYIDETFFDNAIVYEKLMMFVEAYFKTLDTIINKKEN